MPQPDGTIETKAEVAARICDAEVAAVRRLVALGLGRVQPIVTPEDEPKAARRPEDPGLLAGEALHEAMEFLQDLGLSETEARQAAEAMLASLGTSEVKTWRVPEDRGITMRELAESRHHEYFSGLPRVF